MGERGLLAKKAKWGHLSGGLQRSTERRRRSREKTLVFSPKLGEEGWRNATPKCFHYVIISVYIQGVESLLSCFFSCC